MSTQPAVQEPLESLMARADAVRRAWLGDAVHLRALVEISSHCRRACTYCGLRAARRVPRFRLDDAQVLACARQAAALGLGTLVLQAGEDPGLGQERIAALVARVRGETGLVVTLSLGERPRRCLEAWRRAGAERYLMRFETSSAALYRALHPDTTRGLAGRLEQLRWLEALGYQVGTGFLVGLPGQDDARIDADIGLLARLRPRMIGLGPWVPHPDTPLGSDVPGDAGPERVLRCLARARLACPWAHIPVTSALRVRDGDAAARQALAAGATVFMPDFTPPPYREAYAIYPGKGGDPSSPQAQVERLRALVEAAGRHLGQGAGAPPQPPPSPFGGHHGCHDPLPGPA